MIEDAMLLAKPDFLSFIKFAGFSSSTSLLLYYLSNPRKKMSYVNEKNLVVATGCDSGLGYSIAVHCHENLKMSVLACVNKKDSNGALSLNEMFEKSKRFHMIELEITQSSSIEGVRKYTEELLRKNEDLEFHALINNCGVMVFGEAEWQTNDIIEQQINVNLIGTIKMTREMLPLIRKHKSRIINVSSHCGLRSLPTLSVYGATKAGVASFTEALRIEMKPHDVDVINFIPGSFTGSSNLAASQTKYAVKMRESLNEEQLNYYGEYFDQLNGYLSFLSGEKKPQMLKDENIIQAFEEALLDFPPKPRYICEPWRYKLYHALFKITPLPLSDWLIHKFLCLPRFNVKS